MAGELRYFEVAPGGFSTLERHEHMHGVLILRGSGHCLVGDEVKSLETNDLVTVPPMTWHQFRATKNEPLGFLCMVNAERDKPQLPTPEDVDRLKKNPGDRGVPGQRAAMTANTTGPVLWSVDRARRRDRHAQPSRGEQRLQWRADRRRACARSMRSVRTKACAPSC